MNKEQETIQISWCTIFPMPYWEDLFRRLARMPQFAMDVYYIRTEQASHPIAHDQATNYKYKVMDSVGSHAHAFIQALTNRNRIWVIGGWGTPSYVCLLALLAMLRREYWIFTDCPVPKGRTPGLLRNTARGLFLRYVFGRSRWILGTGKTAVDALKLMTTEHSKIRNLPYPLDEERFSIEDTGVVTSNHQTDSTKKVIIIFSGRLHLTDKRFDIAIESFRRVCNRLPESVNAELWFAGSGPDEHLLRDLISSCGLASKVKLLGWLDQAQLREVYKQADVYFHPADFEPYGVTVVEALYTGLYSVASSGVGAAVELIAAGKNGSIFPAGDVETASDQLLQAIELTSNKECLKETVRATSLKWSMANYIATLEQLATKRGTPAAI